MDAVFPEGCAAVFRPERLLASGGFGAVYLATQIRLGRQVVVKLLHAQIRDQEENVRRFLDEARITAALSHPNIVRVIDHAVEDGVPWIAYEFLPGSDLRTLLEHGPLSQDEAIEAAEQTCLALEAAHGKGILHRDIKPENVFRVEPHLFKVTDFGIARWSGRDSVRTQTGMLLGTPAYISPEQISGDPASPRTDVYAVGVTLFELLTGRPPFEAESALVLFERHLKVRPPRPGERVPGIRPELDAVVLRALQKRPGDRFASAGEMAAALARCRDRAAAAPEEAPPRPRSGVLSARTVVAGAAGREPPPAPLPRGRRPGLVAVGATLLAVLAGAWVASRPPGPVVATPSATPSGATAPARRVTFLDPRDEACEMSVKLRESGKYEEALAALRSVMDEPNQAVLHEVSSVLQNLHDPKGMKEYFYRFLGSRDPVLARCAHVHASNATRDLGEFAESIRLCREGLAISAPGESYGEWLLRGRVDSWLRALDEAEKLGRTLDHAAALADADAAAKSPGAAGLILLLRARILTALGPTRYPDARRCYELLDPGKGPSTDIWDRVLAEDGSRRLRIHDWSADPARSPQPRGRASAEATAPPTSCEALFERISSALAKGEARPGEDPARGDRDLFTKYFPKHNLIDVIQAMRSWRSGDGREQECHQKALDTCRKDASSLYLYASFLLRTHREQRAVECATRVHDLDRMCSWAHSLRLHALLEAGRGDEALRLFPEWLALPEAGPNTRPWRLGVFVDLLREHGLAAKADELARTGPGAPGPR